MVRQMAGDRGRDVVDGERITLSGNYNTISEHEQHHY